MLFHSLPFAILLTAVILLDRAAFAWLPRERGWRVRLMVYLVASLIFYGAWNWHYLGLVFFSIGFDWMVSRALGRETRPARRTLLLGASITTQLTLLAVFKYYNFFRETLAAAGPLAGLAEWLPASELLLPIGISFYTFQSMSYTIDVYRRDIEPVKSLARFATFVAFFPQLVAGPIVRAKDFLWQLEIPKRPSDARLVAGIERFGIGLFKKTVIADNLSPLTDQVFADPASFSGINNLFALFAWGLVIYCDFSGYSDMAIGLARILGFKFIENFNFPYLARSVTDFCRALSCCPNP